MDTLRKYIDFSSFTKPGIGRKFALLILIFSSIVTLISTAVQLSLEFQRDVNDIERSLGQIRTSYSASLAGSLWVVSKQDVKLQLDGILRLPDMQYIEVRNENDDIVSTVGSNRDDRVLREVTPLYYKHQNQLVFVGTLMSVASLEGAYQRLIDKVLVILFSQTIKTFLVSLFILVLFQYLIGRHLTKIARHSEVIDTTTPDQNLRLDRVEKEPQRKDELGHVVSAINNMRDRMSNAFKKLLYSEENARLTVEVIQDYAMLRLDVNGNIATWNVGAQRIFGYTTSEIIGQPFSIFFPKDASENTSFEQLIVEVKHNSLATCEGQRKRKDGSTFWAEGSLAAIYDANNVLIGYSTVTRDVSERKSAEKEQQRLHRALRLLSDCNLLLVNAKEETDLLSGVCQLIVYTGGYVVAWVGVPENDANKTVRPVVQTGFGENYLEEIRVSWDENQDIGRGPTGTAVRTCKPQFFQHGFSNSQITPWRSTATKRGIQSGLALPMLSGDKLFGILSLYSSEPNAFTQEEVKLLEELSRNVVFGIERLRSMEERAVAQSANQAKSAFLANMSHEIRTPLNAILGSAQLMRLENVTPQQEARLDTIDTAGEHLLEIINSILDLSKIEANKFALETGPIRIDRILSSVNSLLIDRASAKQLDLIIERNPVPERLLGDATRLKQALLNYGGNAVKFTNKGSITIRANTITETTNEVVLRFEVQDTGIGISAHAAKRLFSAFEQVDSSTTRKYGGTGLGLAITKKFAQLMGGDAGVDSEPGNGSIFWFTARFKKDIATEHESVSPVIDSIENVVGNDYTQYRVLVVDDEPANRKLLNSILEKLNPHVDIAENGAIAIELVSRNQYDLIFMDMQMPIMDGLNATQQIRQLENGKSVRIVALTGNAFNEDRERCIKAGMTDFVTKPLNVKALLFNTRTWLSESNKLSNKEVV